MIPNRRERASSFDTGSPADAAPVDASPVDGGSEAGTCPIGLGETVTASIKVTVDDYLRLWVNGVLVDDKTTTWGVVDTRTVTLFRHPSIKNVIAVEARNEFNAGGYDRGLLADLTYDAGAGFDSGADGGVPNIVTDLTWKIIGTSTDGGLPDGGLADGGDAGPVAWFAPAFDDSAWVAPTDQGAHGMAPWGSVFTTSSARWLWSYDSASAVSKPASEFVYFRKTFYLDRDGLPRDTPVGCP